MWFLRTHSESYQCMAFLLLTFEKLWDYYKSVYYYWYGVWLIFLIVGIILNIIHSGGKKTVKVESKSRDNVPVQMND